MKIKDLAFEIAQDFNKQVEENGCENFKEMKSLFDWTAKDIRNEIDYMVNNPVNGFLMLNDGTMCNLNEKDEDEECTYGTFKKMIFEHVK